MIRKSLLFILAFFPVRLGLRCLIRMTRWFDGFKSLCWCAVNVPAAHRKLVRLHWSVEVKYPQNIEWGDRLTIGPGTTLGAYGGISFGDDAIIGAGAVVSHHVPANTILVGAKSREFQRDAAPPPSVK